MKLVAHTCTSYVSVAFAFSFRATKKCEFLVFLRRQKQYRTFVLFFSCLKRSPSRSRTYKLKLTAVTGILLRDDEYLATAEHGSGGRGLRATWYLFKRSTGLREEVKWLVPGITEDHTKQH